jgi:hypothetical protein
MDQGRITTKAKPMQLRYLLHIHTGQVNAERAERLHATFATSTAASLVKSSRPHTQWEIQ